MGVPAPRDAITSPNFGKLYFRPHDNRDHHQIHPGYGCDQLDISDAPDCYDDANRWLEMERPLPRLALLAHVPLRPLLRRFSLSVVGVLRRDAGPGGLII